MNTKSQGMALAFWKRAKEFADAASLVAEAAGGQVSLPAYYLWGHSIELSLKVFLIGQDISLEELKSRDLGHNLTSLLKKAETLGINKAAHLYPADIGVITVLTEDYAGKKFEYGETTQFRLPFMHLTKRTAERLVFLLNPNHKVKQSNSEIMSR